MGINERIKDIRYDAHLNQTEFADKIGLKQGAISKLEKNGNTVTDQNKQIICDKFHINLHWLETGEGEMYAPPAERDLIDEMRERYRLNPIEEQILRVYMEMTLPERERLVRYAKEANGFLDKAFEAARTIAATIAASPQAPASAEPPASAGEDASTLEETSTVAGDELDADGLTPEQAARVKEKTDAFRRQQVRKEKASRPALLISESCAIEA